MSENAHGIRRFTLAATVARNFKPLPVHGFGIVVYSAPADASAVLQLGDQDGAQLPLKPGLRFRSPVPFDKLYLSNVAGASGNVDFLVVTDPEAEAAYGGLGDITMGGVTPQMDATDRQAVSIYGKDAAAGDTPVLVDASGSLSVGPKAGTSSLTDGMSNGPQGPRTFGGADLHQIVRQLKYNGATWDRVRNVTKATIFASAARTTSSACAAFSTYGARAAFVATRVTVNPGGAETLTVKLRGKSPTDWDLAETSAMAFGGIAGVKALLVGAGVAGGTGIGGNVDRVVQVPIPESCDVYVGHSAAGSWTYQIDLILVY